MPPGRVEPWNASNRCARALSEKPGPVSETSITTTAALAPAGNADLVARRDRARRAALHRLHGVAGEIEQDAEQLIVVGIDGQPALDRD